MAMSKDKAKFGASPDALTKTTSETGRIALTEEELNRVSAGDSAKMTIKFSPEYTRLTAKDGSSST
jgi:hypothetical protein